jgi:hypothetical protein
VDPAAVAAGTVGDAPLPAPAVRKPDGEETKYGWLRLQPKDAARSPIKLDKSNAHPQARCAVSKRPSRPWGSGFELLSTFIVDST